VSDRGRNIEREVLLNGRLSEVGHGPFVQGR
jgi:hypothetical protein